MLRTLLVGFGILVLLSLAFESCFAADNTTARPDLNGCSDKIADCSKYINQCTPKFPDVQKNCKKTCNLCPTAPPKVTMSPETPENATTPPYDQRSTTQTSAPSSTSNPPYSTPPLTTYVPDDSMGSLCIAGTVTWCVTVLWAVQSIMNLLR